jgi:hypothetical protein
MSIRLWKLKSEEKLRLNIKRLVYAIVILLVFEGLLRKLVPSIVGLVIFFLKDILCIIALIFIGKARAKLKADSLRLFKIWKILPLLLIPLLINTLFKDSLLPLFGLKQYLLYISVAFLVPLAYPPGRYKEFKRFIIFVTFLIIPTSLVAILQNSLPPTHWLNLSVGGDSLEAFSAAGYLRVSSTFSFTGQYSWFINLTCVFLVFRVCMPIKPSGFFFNKINNYLLALISILLIIGTFITGGRTAVLGCGACLFIGFIFASIKSPRKFILQGSVILLGLLLCLGALRAIKPEFFAAYDQRSEGNEERSHSEEIEERVAGGFFGWTTWFFKEETIQILFGNGLGVMSNGSDKISSYANVIRQSLWTETDLATIVWEGGLYLLIIWYGLRIWVIGLVLKIWRNMKVEKTGVALSFLLAYIIITGLYGTISAQPPLAIWWWLTVGTFFTIDNFYQNKNNQAKNNQLGDLSFKY